MSSRFGGSPTEEVRPASPLVEAVRPGPPRDYLLTGAYHTPSGPLHLGHLGGPFLSADVLARHLEAIGHRVTRIGSTDAHEAYVLYAAELESRSPAEVATSYGASARAVLEGFDMRYDAFIDFSAPRWRAGYHEACHRLAEEMLRRQRLSVTPVRLPRGRSGRFVIGPFAVGRCPLCTAEAAGTSCEDCGMWFGPGALREVRPRLEHDEIVAWEDVPTVYLRASEELTPEAVEERFPSGCAELLERYFAYNGRHLHLTHPLGWGVAWKAHDLGPEAVHVSYGTGSVAAMTVTGSEYQRLTDAELSPFDRGSEVTTILTGGLDAALPSMLLMAFMDGESRLDPFRLNIVNRFMLLDGSKFSTSRRHVVLGRQYLDGGLSPDLFRFYAASLSVPGCEPDFVLSEFSRWVEEFLAGRLDRLCRAAFERIEVGTMPPPLAAEGAERIAVALAAQAAALVPPEVNLAAAAGAVGEWVAVGEEGMVASAPYWWLKALAVLAGPLMPRWAEGLWRSLGGAGSPTLETFERITPVRARGYVDAAVGDPDRIACVGEGSGA